MKKLIRSIYNRKTVKHFIWLVYMSIFQIQAQNYQWAYGFSSTNFGSFYGSSGKVVIDNSSSDIYNVGRFFSDGTNGIDFDPSAATFTLVTGNQFDANGYITKFTSAGAFSQALSFKGAYNEIYDIAVDVSDNMYVTGYYTGAVDFDPSAATFFLPTTSANRAFVAKLNANGTLNWCVGLGTTGDTRGLSIALDQSNNVIIGGSFDNTTDFDPSAATTSLTPVGQDGFILKLTNAGTYVSSIKIGDSGSDAVYDLEIDASNNLFATGIYSSATAFSGATYSGGLDGFVGKFSSTNLTTTWIKGFGGPQDDTPKSIVQDLGGGIICTGYFKGTADFDPNAGVNNLSSPSNTDIDGFVLRLNTSGNLNWVKQITGTSSQAPTGVSIDNSGIIHVSGFYQGISDFNPTSTFHAFATNTGTSEDLFVLKLNGTGNYIQTQIIGSTSGTANERCNSIAVEPNTGFYAITGQLQNSVVDFNTSIPTNTVNGHWFLAKYNNCSLPAVPTSVTSPTVCSGSIATLTVSAGSYTTNWYTSVTATTISATGNTVTTPAISSNYSLYPSNTNTCGTSMRGMITAIVDNNFLTTVMSATSICQGESIVVTASGGQTYNFGSGSTTTNTYTTPPYNNTGTWTSNYTGVNANGCSQTKTYSVSVKALPSVSFGLANTSGAFCDNTINTATWTASGTASTYSWMPGSITGTTAVFNFPSTPGTYSISLTGTGSNGCSKTITNNSIIVNNSPTISVNSGAICPGKTFTMIPSGANTYTFSSGSNTVSPSSTTSYSVMGTSALGCISNAPAVATVSINPTPTIAVNSGSICAGKSFTIIPSGAQTYTISGGQSIVSPTSSTNYSITGTSSLGCIGSNTAIANVIVQSTPTVSIAGSNTVCTGSPISLTANGASTYTWNTGAQTSTISPSVSINTNYTVTGAIGTCTSNAIKTVSVVANPTLTTSSSVNSICNGANVSINASGASTYLWMPGSLTNSVITVSPNSTTAYTVTGTAVNGCTNTAVKSITVNATPTVNVNSGAICTGGTFTITPSGTGVSFYNITGGNYIVNPSSNTTYTVTGTSAQGCTNTAVSTVSVQSSLTVSISGSNTVCSGSSVNLTANGAATYTWSTGSTNYTIAPSPISNTTYSVTGASGTCSSTAVMSVTVLPTPTINATTSNTLICSGNSASLTAIGASSYIWMPGNLTGSMVTISPSSNQTYTVTGTAANGCTNQSVITQSVSLCTGIENTVNNFPLLNFYPNPFNDIITIESEMPVLKIIINDVLGKEVLNIEKINQEQYIHISTNELPDGIFFMTVLINNQYKTYKIIKK